ncbi:MAG: hypothetical protein IJT21_01955, partial [Synergistaceae bacterium]|nr:hypothetical protein [Synergistaceae bacterium]
GIRILLCLLITCRDKYNYHNNNSSAVNINIDALSCVCGGAFFVYGGQNNAWRWKNFKTYDR